MKTKQPKSDIVRQTTKTIKTVAKINLINILNESVAKPIKKFIKHEICDIRREKLKSEFHKPGQQFESDPYTQLDSNFIKNKNVSLLFKGVNSPTKTADVSRDVNAFIERHKPTPDMVKDILGILKSVGINVDPTEEPSVMPSPRKYEKTEFVNMTAGRYVHLGIESFLKKILKMNGVKAQDEDNQILYIDIAFYVIKSAKHTGIEIPQHLIILGRPAGGFYNQNCKEAFVVGVYEGLFTTPTIANEILRPFVDEMLSLRENKIQHNKVQFSVQIRAIICDPIANSLVTCTSLPDSLFGCSKCNQNGTLQFNHGITSYPEACRSFNLRCDDDFLYPDQIDHHNGIPILRELEIGLVSQFYIDYKHTVCLGVMRRLLELWISKGKLDYRLNKNSIIKITEELEKIGTGVPKEFTSKPKPLEDYKDWTAYDYRQFLLYYGPVVLQKRLPQKYYVHFLHLNLALRIMINPDTQIQCSANICSSLLRNFVQEFAQLYGADLIDYNIHNLLHIEDVIFKSFSVDSVGGFIYDKQIEFIVSSIQSNDTLETLVERVEENTRVIFENRKNFSSLNYPYLDENSNLICRYATLSKNEPDNYVITTGGDIVIIDEIAKTVDNSIVIYGRPATSIVMYQAPATIQKMMLMMAKLSRQIFKLNDIKAKAVKISTSAGDYILPLLTP